jgi:hypothetical protein
MSLPKMLLPATVRVFRVVCLRTERGEHVAATVEAALAVFCRTPLSDLGFYAEPRILTHSLSHRLTGSNLARTPWRQGGGRMPNGCGVSGYAVGKVSVSLVHRDRESFSRNRWLSFRRLRLAQRGIAALNSAGSSARGLERRRIHSPPPHHQLSRRAFKHCIFAHPPRGRGPVSDPAWPSAMMTSRGDYESQPPRNKKLSS